MINILNEQHPNMQFAMVNDTIKILNDHDDGGVAATMIFVSSEMAYKDANGEIQFTLDELFDAFVKGAVINPTGSKLYKPEYIDFNSGAVVYGDGDYAFAEGYDPDTEGDDAGTPT